MSEKVPTPEEAAAKMRAIVDDDDKERAGSQADNYLCRLLCSLGYKELVEVYQGARLWRA